MAQQANIVLNDGTPGEDKTFVPYIPYGGPTQPAVWICKEGVAPLAYPRIEIGMKRTSNGSNKIAVKLTVPNVTYDAAVGPKLISQALFDAHSGGFIIPDTSTDWQRAWLYAFTKNLLAHSVMDAWVRNIEAAY